MRRATGARRAAVVAAGLVLLGCRDVGLEGNIPRAEAEGRTYRYAVYEMTEAAGHGADVLAFDARNWVASAAVEAIPDRLLRRVGDAGGTPVFAMLWSEAPYARLYAQIAPGRWHPLERVP